MARNTPNISYTQHATSPAPTGSLPIINGKLQIPPTDHTIRTPHSQRNKPAVQLQPHIIGHFALPKPIQAHYTPHIHSAQPTPPTHNRDNITIQEIQETLRLAKNTV